MIPGPTDRCDCRAAERENCRAANESRDWPIWSDLATVLRRRARKLYASELLGIELDNTVYALNSSTVDLCLSLFDWAPFRSTKAAIKLQTVLDLRTAVSAFIHISDGKLHDVNGLDMLSFEAGSFYDLVERTRRSQPEVRIELRVELGRAALDTDAALTLYRAAQEGISNALRHGQARTLRLTVNSDAGAVTLDLSDDGTGLAPDWSARTGHYGLRWMAERIEALGGAFLIEPALPHGVRLQVRLPLDSDTVGDE